MFGMWRQGGSVASVCTERAKQHMGHVSELSRIFVTFLHGQTLQRPCLSLPSSAAMCLLVNSKAHTSLTHRPHFAPSIPFTNISFSSSSNSPKGIYMHSFFCETYDPDQSVPYVPYVFHLYTGRRLCACCLCLVGVFLPHRDTSLFMIMSFYLQ